MKTQAIHLTVQEAGLMCNLLYAALKASGKDFKDQALPVRTLSAKLARTHAKLSGYKLKPLTEDARLSLPTGVENDRTPTDTHNLVPAGDGGGLQAIRH